MKRRISNILLLILLPLLLHSQGCGRKSEPGYLRTNGPVDTVYTRDAALDAMVNNPDKALNIIDSAYIVGNVSDFQADILRLKVYTQSLEGVQIDSAKLIGERLMQHDSIVLVPANKLTVLDQLITAARFNADDEQLLLLTVQKAALCREIGNETEALRTDAERGALLTRLGHMDEGMKLIDDVIDRLDGVRRFNEMDTWIIAVRRKINILEQIPGSSEIIATNALRILTRLDDYSRNPQEYHDGSVREPGPDERPFYVDFYQSRCYAYLADAYSSTNPAEARRYLTRYESTQTWNTYNGRMMIAPILCRLGEYDRMEAIYREMDSRQETSDTVNNMFLSMLHDRAVAAEAQGRTQDALSLWKRYDVLNGKLSEKTITSKAYYYAASYQTAEQQKALEMERARGNRLLNFAWFMGILASLFFGYIVFATIRHFWRLSSSAKGAEVQVQAASTVPQKRPSAMDDEELFNYISGIVKREQLFLNPMLDRQAIMKRIGGLSAHRVGAAFSKGSEHHSLPGYIRSLRLEYACSLLISHPEMTVKAVGEASGFSNVSTFCSDFKTCYGVTPSDYRKGNTVQ